MISEDTQKKERVESSTQVTRVSFEEARNTLRQKKNESGGNTQN